MKELDDGLCKIWAMEQNKQNGSAHYCHVESKGLGGAVYPKSIVPNRLMETLTEGDPSQWEYVLRACEPHPDAAVNEQCEDCVFKRYSGIKHLWGIK